MLLYKNKSEKRHRVIRVGERHRVMGRDSYFNSIDLGSLVQSKIKAETCRKERSPWGQLGHQLRDGIWHLKLYEIMNGIHVKRAKLVAKDSCLTSMLFSDQKITHYCKGVQGAVVKRKENESEQGISSSWAQPCPVWLTQEDKDGEISITSAEWSGHW